MTPGRSLDLGATHTPGPAAPTHTASGDDDTDCKQVRCIALTFDDGPAAPETATLLTYLAQYTARATFFTTGQNVDAHPDLVRAEARAGHEVGNHSARSPPTCAPASEHPPTPQSPGVPCCPAGVGLDMAASSGRWRPESPCQPTS